MVSSQAMRHLTPLRLFSLLACLLTPTTALPSQAQSYPSPAGFDTKGGNSSHLVRSGWRLFGIDDSNRNLSATLKSFALRRENLAALNVTTQLSLNLGLADMAKTYSEFDRNYLPNSRQTVFPSKRFSWTLPQLQSRPTPFDLKIDFATPFVYSGAQGALLWDIDWEYVSTNFEVDLDSRGLAGAGIGTRNLACPGLRMECYLECNGLNMPRYGMRLRVNCPVAPTAAPINLSLALTNANLRLPGFCTSIHALPLVTIPLGMAHPRGRLHYQYFSFNYDATLHGLVIENQAFTVSNGQLLLSEANDSPVPRSAPRDPEASASIFSYAGRFGTPVSYLLWHGSAAVGAFGT